VGEAIFDIAKGLNQPDLTSSEAIFRRWKETKNLLSALADSSPTAALVGRGATIAAPIANPGAIYCAGANYRDHIEEMAKRSGTKPLDPRAANIETWFFLKTPICITGPDAAIELPSYSNAIDWEAELAAIIGMTARDVRPEDALDYVAGYTIANDLSARDHSKRTAWPIFRRSSGIGWLTKFLTALVRWGRGWFRLGISRSRSPCASRCRSTASSSRTQIRRK
jgi:2-keto-4-pentenoate hydratase/2-oxohepta-3-ene-1,7-dioic acid hydratase in catechol pathway